MKSTDWHLFKQKDMCTNKFLKWTSIVKFFAISNLLLLFTFSTIAQNGNSILQGTVIDKNSSKALPFATVSLLGDSLPIRRTYTDFDGNYQLDSIETGTYDLKASYVGYQTQKISRITILPKQNKTYNFSIIKGPGIICGVIVIDLFPIIEIDNASTEKKLTREEIKRLASF